MFTGLKINGKTKSEHRNWCSPERIGLFYQPLGRICFRAGLIFMFFLPSWRYGEPFGSRWCGGAWEEAEGGFPLRAVVGEEGGLERMEREHKRVTHLSPLPHPFALGGIQVGLLKCDVTQLHSTVMKEIGVSMAVVNMSVSFAHSMTGKAPRLRGQTELCDLRWCILWLIIYDLY